MTKDNNVQREQNQDPNDLATYQNSITRELVEDHTGTRGRLLDRLLKGVPR